MSVEIRQEIAASPHIIFRTEQQRDDIVNVHGVQTQLIAFLQHLINKGAILEVTAVKSDHRDDSFLNPNPPHSGTHAGGWAIDCWPLSRVEQGAYLNAMDEQFQHFLELASEAPWLFQIGLAGSAWHPLNVAAAGDTVFQDQGDDHVHLSTHE